MINICTLCDNSYILKGLAMHDSLMCNIDGEFTLYWLCCDDEIYDKLSLLELPNVKLFSLIELEKENAELLTAKSNPACAYGNQWSQYMWCMTPFFSNYILKKYIKEGEKLLYVDSDIYFYRSPQVILDVVGDRSIGLHSHRFSGQYREDISVGWFNIGVVCFTKNEMGLKASEQWKDWLLSTTHEYYLTHGHTGDQKYAELFHRLIGWDNISVFDDERISHLAPWNSDNLMHHPNKNIIHNNQFSPVVFFHFSHFTISNGQWKDSISGEWNPARDANVRVYYQEYFDATKMLSERYNISL